MEMIRASIGRPTTDNQETLNVMLFEGTGYRIEITPAGNLTVRAEFRATHRSPAIDTHPIHLMQCTFNQSLKAVGDTQHRMPFIQRNAYSSTDSCIHTGRGRTGVHDSQ